MREIETLYRLYCDRRSAHSGDNSRMVDLALIYDGNSVVRITELDETAENSIPNLVAQGIDSYARYAASNQPDVTCAPVRPNVASSRTRASQREQVINGWWQGSKMPLLDYQRFRYYFGYGAAPVILRPHPDAPGVPRWEARSPMGVYPGPRDLPYSPEIPDCFVAVTRPAKWVTGNYGLTFGSRVRPDDLVEVVEYIDAEQVTVFCTGPAGADMSWNSGDTPAWGASWHGKPYGQEIINRRIERLDGQGEGGWLALLSSVPNYAGVCTVSHPGVISLSKVSGFIDGILSKHRLMARLTALYVEGVTSGIRPAEWIEIDPATNGRGVIKEADGLRGIRGQIEGGKIVVPQVNPTYLAGGLIDKIEAYSREEAGIVSEFGGASGANVRTRARGEAVWAASVDPRVLEAHTIAETAREHEITLAVAIAKGYGRSRQFSMHVSKGRQSAQVTYRPAEVFENDQATVRYPIGGTDRQGLIIAAAQSIGTEMLSKASARRLNPLVEDANAEEVAIRAEALETLALGQLQQLASANPAALTAILRDIRAGMLPEDAIERANKRMQELQASSGAPGEPTGAVEPGAPEAQPGIGAPGGGGQAPETVNAPPQSIRNLAALMVQSRQPGRQSRAEQGAA